MTGLKKCAFCALAVMLLAITASIGTDAALGATVPIGDVRAPDVQATDAPGSAEPVTPSEAAAPPDFLSGASLSPADASLPLRSAARASWVDLGTTDPHLQVQGGARAASLTAKGDYYYDASKGLLTILSSTPLTLRTTVNEAGTTEDEMFYDTTQAIEIKAGVKAQLTFDGVRLSVPATTQRSPLNLATNVYGTADGAKATCGDDIVKPTQLYLTLAPYSDNRLRHEAQTTVGSGMPAIRCGEGSAIVIDDAVRNLDEAGNIVTPEGGMVPRDVTLIDGAVVKKGQSLSALEPAGEPDENGNVAKGTLSLYGGGYSAALGGSYREDAGTIIINGGRITAKAAVAAGDVATSKISAMHGGAGIGGGVNGSGTRTIINGGEVYARSSYHGAGIGAGMGIYVFSGVPDILDDALGSHFKLVNRKDGKGNRYHVYGGDIYVNGGYVEAHGGGHGNAIGASCSSNESSNTEHIIKVTGGTLLTSTALTAKGVTTYDIGGKGGHVLVTGGSVLVGGASKFQGIDGKGGIAYNTHDVNVWDDIREKHPDTYDKLPSGDEVFMVTVDLNNSIDQMTDESIVSFRLTVGGEEYPYGAPASFSGGKLFLWLPKWAAEEGNQKEVAIDMAVLKDGNVQRLDPLYITEPTIDGANHVKRFRTFVIDGSTYPLAKPYDGLPFDPLFVSSDHPLTYVRDDGEEEPLDDPTLATFQYRLRDGAGNPVGEWFEAGGEKPLPTNDGAFDVTVTSTQYAVEGSEFSNSFWGHRATGVAAIEKVPADVVELRAVWLDASGAPLEGVHGDDLRERAATLRVRADVTSGRFDDGSLTAATCESPLGSVAVMLDDTVLASSALSDANAQFDQVSEGAAEKTPGQVLARQDWKAASYDGARRHTVATLDVPKAAVYALLDENEDDPDRMLSVGYAAQRNYLDIDSAADETQPRVVITKDGLEDPDARYTVATAAAPEGGGAVTADAADYGRREKAVATVAAAHGAGWQVESITVDGTVYGRDRLGTLGAGGASSVSGHDYTVAPAENGGFTVTFPAMKRNHAVSASFEKRPCLVTATVRGGVGGSAAVASRNGGALDAPATRLEARHGDTVGFSWEAAFGWKVSDILVNGASLKATAPLTVTDAGSWTAPPLTGPVAFEVVYEKRTYQVTVSGAPAEGGTASGGGAVAFGDAATVVYAPAEGWHVASVAVDGTPWPVASYPDGLTLEKVSADHAVAVAFERNAYPLTLTVSDGSGGAIEGPASVTHGEGASIAWRAAEGYRITGVTVDGVAHDPADFGDADAGTLALQNVRGPHAVHVAVERRCYSVTAEVSAGNGEVSPAATVSHGGEATMTWKAALGWEVTSVTVDGLPLSQTLASAGSYRFENVTAPHKVVVSFARKGYRVETYADRTLGTLTASAEVPFGDDFPVRWSPNANAYVEAVTVDGATLGDAGAVASGEYLFRQVQESHTFAVDFKRIPDKALAAITTTGAGEGHVVGGVYEYAPGPDSAASFGWTPEEGHRVEGGTLTVFDGGTEDEGRRIVSTRALTEDELEAGVADGFTVKGLEEGYLYQVAIAFAPQTFTVATAVEGQGACTPTFTETWGKTARVNFAAAEGWRVGAVYVDGKRAAAAAEAGFVAFENLAADHQVRVVFEQIFYRASITGAPKAGGAVGIDGAPAAGADSASASVAHGKGVRLTWAAAEGWRVTAVRVNGVDEPGLAAGAAEYAVGALTEDIDVAVAFERLRFAVQTSLVDASGNPVDGTVGAITPSLADDTAVAWGDDAAVRWTLQPGWRVAQVIADGRVLSGEEVRALEGSYTFAKVKEAHSLRVVVERDRVSVTGEALPPEGGTVTAPNEVAWGDDARVTWAAAEGWRATAVLVDGKPVGDGAVAAGEIVLPSVREDCSVKVLFEKRAYALRAQVRGNVGGTAACADALGAPAASVVHGESFTFTWAADAGYTCTDIVVNGKSITASGLFSLSDAGSWTCPAAAGAYSFEVVYERRSYQVTATGAPAEGGTVSGGGTVRYGDDAQVAYAAAPGWHVAAVTVDGARWPVESFPTGLTLTQVTANREVAVTFERNAYPLTLTVSDGAGATIEGPASVVHGASATATWKARPGYVVTAVTVDGVAHDPADFGDASAGSCEFPNVAEAHGVHVTVQRKTYPVATAVVEGNGTVSPSAVVAHGEKAKVTWKAADGWRVDTVTVDGAALAGDAAQAGSYLFENVDGAHRVEVSFTRQNYLIETFADLTLGTITSSTEVPYESDFTVRWSPSATAYVEGAQVDGEPMEDEEALEQGAYTFRCVGATHRFAVAFKPLPDKALVATAAVGPGTVWLEGTDESAFDPGTDVTVRWAPEEGHEVSAAVLTETDGDGNVVENRPLTGEELAAGAGEGFVLRNLAEGRVYRVTVSFAPRRFTVATESVGRGTCTATFQEAWGKSATVSFAPEPGWRVARVMVDGAEDTTALAAGSVRFAALAADHEVRVEFEQIFHRASVACEPAEGGAVTLNGAPGASSSAAEAALGWGSAATFGWRPAEGWRVAAVTVNGSDRPGLAQGATEYAVASLEEDVAVHVIFERIPLAITCSASDPAAVAFTAPATVLFGDAATVGWKVKQGWSISRVLVNGTERPELAGADGTIFARVTADQTVHVEVSREVFPVDTAVGGPHADRATISAPASVAYGDDHTVSWTVEEGFMASSVTVDGVARPELAGPDAPRFWTFSDVRGPHAVVVEVEKAPEVYTVAVRKVGSVAA